MKYILILVLLMAAQAHAGLFDNGEQQRQYEQQIQNERQNTGGWMVVAGILGVGGIILFGVGTAIGSACRRKEVKKDE